MGDVVERLRTAIRHRNLYKEHILCVAADEIERLRSEIANDVIFKALRERIEELEADQIPLDARLSLSCVIQNGVASDFLLAVNGEPTDQSISLPEACHIITDSQIDAAWERAGEWAYVQPDCLETLAELGIVRCEMCDGQGAWGISEEGDTHLCDCCDGKRWVKR
jgi:hypothetical protein